MSLLHPALAHVEAWQVEPETAAATLRRHFGVSTLDGFGLHAKPEAVRAAAAVLAYLHQMQPSALSLLTRLHTYTAGEFMMLDEATRRNLELTETMRGGDLKGSLLGVLDATLTPMGSRLLRRWINQPLLDVTAINHRLDAVQLFFSNTVLRLEVREALKTVGDLERWTNRTVQGVALPRDLVGMREVLRQIARAAREAHRRRAPARAPACPEVLRLLDAAIADDPPATVANTGFMRLGFDAELDSLVERSRGAKDWIANLEQVERQRLDIKSLKVGYNKVFGYYIEVTSTHQNKVPPEYIRKQTIANGERFITPDLKEYETLVLNADERRLEIEQQLFKEVCSQVAAHGANLLQLAQGLAELDVFTALAEVALLRRYVRPTVNEARLSRSMQAAIPWWNWR